MSRLSVPSARLIAAAVAPAPGPAGSLRHNTRTATCPPEGSSARQRQRTSSATLPPAGPSICTTSRMTWYRIFSVHRPPAWGAPSRSGRRNGAGPGRCVPLTPTPSSGSGTGNPCKPSRGSGGRLRPRSRGAPRRPAGRAGGSPPGRGWSSTGGALATIPVRASQPCAACVRMASGPGAARPSSLFLPGAGRRVPMHVDGGLHAPRPCPSPSPRPSGAVRDPPRARGARSARPRSPPSASARWWGAWGWRRIGPWSADGRRSIALGLHAVAFAGFTLATSAWLLLVVRVWRCPPAPIAHRHRLLRHEGRGDAGRSDLRPRGAAERHRPRARRLDLRRDGSLNLGTGPGALTLAATGVYLLTDVRFEGEPVGPRGASASGC